MRDQRWRVGRRVCVTSAIAGMAVLPACAEDGPGAGGAWSSYPSAPTVPSTTVPTTSVPATTAPIPKSPATSAAATTVPVATELAPSQESGSTVPAPHVPPPCDVADLEFTAAGEAIVAIRNLGAVECEVDVFESPNIDPLMEPGIWLHAGGEGELAVAPLDDECAAPADVTSVDLIVNGEPVTAPVHLPSACGVMLIAIYTAE